MADNDDDVMEANEEEEKVDKMMNVRPLKISSQVLVSFGPLKQSTTSLVKTKQS